MEIRDSKDPRTAKGIIVVQEPKDLGDFRVNFQEESLH